MHPPHGRMNVVFLDALLCLLSRYDKTKILNSSSLSDFDRFPKVSSVSSDLRKVPHDFAHFSKCFTTVRFWSSISKL